MVAQTRHQPFGEVRWESGSRVTDFGFTGQRNEVSFGLMDYNARFYSPGLGRFVSADIIIPEVTDPQSFNRFSYVRNNPLNFNDPSGYCRINDDGVYEYGEDCTVDEFAGLSWEQRKDWMNQFMEDNKVPWFFNILGIIDYFANDIEFSALDGWASYADAAVLQAIQDGWRLHNHDEAIGNSGKEWEKFFSMLFPDDENIFSEDDIRSQWGKAEQAGVNYGNELATKKYGLTSKASYFVLWGNAYRTMVEWEVWTLPFAGPAISPLFDPRTTTSQTFVNGWSDLVISGSYNGWETELSTNFGTSYNLPFEFD